MSFFWNAVLGAWIASLNSHRKSFQRADRLLHFATLPFCQFCIFDRDGAMQSATRQELKRRQPLKQLIEIYALRTRRLSEAIAVLAGDFSAERRIEESIIEVKNLSRLVEQAGADLSAFVGQPTEESPNE
jgi:hypothetical protein